VLGSYGILSPPGSTALGIPWDPSNNGNTNYGNNAQRWPTQREMRALGAQVIVISDQGTPGYAYKWGYDTAITGTVGNYTPIAGPVALLPAGPSTTSAYGGLLNNGYVADDGYTDYTGFSACQNQDGLDVRTRPFNAWSYIGEDRSGSDFFGTVPGSGHLNPAQVTTAANCGFGMVNVDFRLAPQYTPVVTGSACLFPGFLADIIPSVASSQNYSSDIGNPDLWREAAIWSWDTNDYGSFGPAFLAPNGRWRSSAPTATLPFACAVGAGN
jgi:hypothetical protein